MLPIFMSRMSALLQTVTNTVETLGKAAPADNSDQGTSPLMSAPYRDTAPDDSARLACVLILRSCRLNT